MTVKDSLADIRAQLETLQQNLAAKIAEFRNDESASPAHRAKAEALQTKMATVKGKLPADEGSVWDAIRQEIRRDVDALAQDFNHTVGYIDQHYREQK